MRNSLVLLAATILGAGVAHGAQPKFVDYYVFDGDKVHLKTATKTEVLEAEHTFPDESILTPEGVLNWGDEEMPEKLELQKGHKILADGSMIYAGEIFVPMRDHVILVQNQMMQMENRLRQRLSGPLKLSNGTLVHPDGQLIYQNGTRAKLINGQILGLDGNRIPNKDFIIAETGQIVVQKDAFRIRLSNLQTLALEDGSKVTGDGRLVLWPSGRTLKLQPEDIVEIEGSVLPIR